MLTQARMDYVAQVALLPFALLINFSLFQYLVGLFFNRRAQPLTVLLLVCAFLGFAAIVPFSVPDNQTFSYLNDISETASTLTFLVQIVILGRDICKKVKIKSLMWITKISELIIAIEVLLILLTMFKIADDKFEADWLDEADKIALWFIFVFRFYYISMARGGFMKTLRTRRLEIFLYLLFSTNEYPFMVLTAATNIDWDPVQACWHRLTLMMCIVFTIHDKHRSSGTSNRTMRGAKSTAAHAGTLTRTPSKLQTVGPLETTVPYERRHSSSKPNKSPSIRGPSIGGLAATNFSTSLRRIKSTTSVRPSPPVVDLKKPTALS